MFSAILLFLILIYCFNRWIKTPIDIKESLTRAFRRKGFKVLNLPFKLLGAPFLEDLIKNF